MKGMRGWLSLGILMAGMAGAQPVSAGEMEPVSFEEEISEETLLDLYSPILDQYNTALLEQWSSQEYEAAGLCGLCAFCTNPSQAGYWLEDVDYNGIEELLIGETDASASEEGRFFQLYTLIGDTPVLMASSTEYSQYYLCADGGVSADTVGTSGYPSWSYYTVDSDQAVLALTETVFCGDTQGGEPGWFYNGIGTEEQNQQILEEDAMEVMAAREYEAIEYRPFEDYVEL